MEFMINSKLIKSLRLEKSWSQEKLATVSGLDLRTVQWAESDGIASLKTKLALASALNVKPDYLVMSEADLQTKTNTAIYGYIGTGIGLVCSYTGITYSVLYGATSIGQAGVWYGVIGALAGFTCCLIGVLKKRGSVV